jgi:hypothetical protein
VEEVRDGADLVLRHVWGKYKTFEREPAEENFDSVCLHHIIDQNDSFTLNNGELDASEKQHEFIEHALGVTVQMLDPFDHCLVSFIFLVKLNNQGFASPHKMSLNGLKLFHLL